MTEIFSKDSVLTRFKEILNNVRLNKMTGIIWPKNFDVESWYKTVASLNNKSQEYDVKFSLLLGFRALKIAGNLYDGDNLYILYDGIIKLLQNEHFDNESLDFDLTYEVLKIIQKPCGNMEIKKSFKKLLFRIIVIEEKTIDYFVLKKFLRTLDRYIENIICFCRKCFDSHSFILWCFLEVLYYQSSLLILYNVNWIIVYGKIFYLLNEYYNQMKLTLWTFDEYPTRLLFIALQSLNINLIYHKNKELLYLIYEFFTFYIELRAKEGFHVKLNNLEESCFNQIIDHLKALIRIQTENMVKDTKIHRTLVESCSILIQCVLNYNIFVENRRIKSEICKIFNLLVKLDSFKLSPTFIDDFFRQYHRQFIFLDKFSIVRNIQNTLLRAMIKDKFWIFHRTSLICIFKHLSYCLKIIALQTQEREIYSEILDTISIFSITCLFFVFSQISKFNLAYNDLIGYIESINVYIKVIIQRSFTSKAVIFYGCILYCSNIMRLNFNSEFDFFENEKYMKLLVASYLDNCEKFQNHKINNFLTPGYLYTRELSDYINILYDEISTQNLIDIEDSTLISSLLEKHIMYLVK